MGDTPALLVVVCCEQTVVHGISDFDYWSCNTLAEPGLVANLFQQSDTADEDDLMAESIDLENGSLKKIISDCSLGLGVAGARGRVAVIPNCLANLLREFHVSLGLMSKTLPKRGIPGGPGILVGIIAGGGKKKNVEGYH